MLHWRGERSGRVGVPLPARRARAAVRQGARSPPAGRSCCASWASSADDITQVLLAGSFGAYLTPLSAVRIGLVPKLALPRIVSAGNVAGEGAKIAALSLRERAEAAVDPARGRVRRAVGPRGLQRPVHRPAGVPGMSSRGRSPAARSPSTCGAIARRRGWEVDVYPVPRCCTTGRSRSRPRSRSTETARALRRGRGRLRRLRHLRRAGRASPARGRAPGRRALLRRVRPRRGGGRRWPSSPAPTS